MRLVSFTLAPLTTAPFASTTLPLNCPVPPCANAAAAQQKTIKRKLRATRIGLCIIFLLQKHERSFFFETQEAQRDCCFPAKFFVTCVLSCGCFLSTIRDNTC